MHRFLVRAALAVGLLVTACTEPVDPPRAGDPAPAFTLVSNDGSAVSLSDYRGRWVVLYFYPKDFSTGCTIQARMFEQDMAKYRARRASVVGISMDSVESHEDFCSAQGLSFPLLSDGEGAVSEAYGSIRGAGNSRFSKRHTFVIGPDGSVVQTYLDVNPQTHSRRVLADLARFQGDASGGERPSVLERLTPGG